MSHCDIPLMIDEPTDPPQLKDTVNILMEWIDELKEIEDKKLRRYLLMVNEIQIGRLILAGYKNSLTDEPSSRILNEINSVFRAANRELKRNKELRDTVLVYESMVQLKFGSKPN